MDLISREAAIDQAMGKLDYTDLIFDTATESEIVYMLRSLPSVPAVPLDKLCNLLSQHLGKIRCNDCWVACSDPCPGTADDWRRVVTKWMEGLDGTN